jgi:hypothetical protein
MVFLERLVDIKWDIHKTNNMITTFLILITIVKIVTASIVQYKN